LGKRRAVKFCGCTAPYNGVPDHLQWLALVTCGKCCARVAVRRHGRGEQRRSCQQRAASGGCGSTAVSFSAGTLAGRIANRLAGVYHAFGISADRYTQLKIWATA